MYSSIIVGVDHTERARRAAETGATLARSLGCPLVLAHASCEHERPRWLDDLGAALDVDEKRILVLEGHAGDALCGVQQAHPDSLLCIATAGHGVLGAALFGSTALEVLARTTHPLLLTGPAAPATTEITRVQACVDELDDRVHIVRLAAQWALHLGAVLDVVRVAPPDVADVGGDLGRLVHDAAGGLGLRVDWDVLHDDEPGRAYADRATHLGAGLIVVGHPDGRAGSLIRETVVAAPCGVVVAAPLRHIRQ
jgi:nucleotide-binding universal stress UspA family protein